MTVGAGSSDGEGGGAGNNPRAVGFFVFFGAEASFYSHRDKTDVAAMVADTNTIGGSPKDAVTGALNP